MRRRSRWVVLALAVGAAVAACGGGQLSVEEIGRSCGEVGDRLAPPYYFEEIASVERIASEDLAAAVRGAAGVQGSGGRDLLPQLGANRDFIVENSSSSREFEAVLTFPSYDRDLRALPDGYDVLLAVVPNRVPRRTARVQIAAIETEDSDLVFAGECAHRFFGAPLAQYRDAVRPQEPLVDVFLDIVANQEAWRDWVNFYEGEGPYAPPTFEDLDPRQRFLDIDDTPAEVLDSLDVFVVELEFPREWAAATDGALCTFAPGFGWNECVAFDSVDKGDTADVFAYGKAGQTLEVWVIDYANAGTTDPLALIGTIDPLPPVTDGVGRVTARISAPDGVTTLDDIADAIAAGTIRMTVTAVAD